MSPKKERLQAARGTKDILPEEMGAWHWMESRAREFLSRYGYQEIRTPAFEPTELFTRGIGGGTDIVDKEMYTFLDKKGRSLSLRPEGTAPVVRAALEHNLIQNGETAKVYYIGPMFRYERTQAGRYRQHTQVGVEAFGSPGPVLDAEIIEMLTSFFKHIGLSDLTARIHSMGCAQCRPGYREALKKFIEGKLPGMCVDCQRRFEINPLRLLDCKEDGCIKALADAPAMKDMLCPDCAAHFKAVQEYLKTLQVQFVIDPKLVRGFDYYTRTIFEVTSGKLGSQNAVAGGGRYDGLVEELGGPMVPAIGFSLGVERVLMACAESGIKLPQEPPAFVFVALMNPGQVGLAIELCRGLREQGIASLMDHDGKSLKSQMRHAEKERIPFVVFLGEEELKSQSVNLKNMKTGAQQTVKLTELAKTLTNFLN